MLDHHDLHVIQKLAHLFGGAVGALVFRGDPGLGRLLDDLLADEVGALVEFIDGQRPLRTGLCLFGQFCEQRFKSLHGFLQSL